MKLYLIISNGQRILDVQIAAAIKNWLQISEYS